MTKEYWSSRVEWYADMARHLREQKEHADQQEKQKLSKELERVYNEIGFIRDNHLV